VLRTLRCPFAAHVPCGHPHSAKRGTTNSTWKDFEASPLILRVEGLAAYVDAPYSSHAPLIKEHALKNVLVLPVCAPHVLTLARRLPIVEITRVGELQTKPFIHDVNQQGMHTCACSNLLCFGCLRAKLRKKWWRQTGSNRRPEACKATALPTELCPLKAKHTTPVTQSVRGWWAWEDLNFRPHAYQARALTN
jgi:hypothetical protein